jgi:kynurenine formamidase|tara:strand:+ start:527 stop:1144 length:618 start_codon:yes stop_codon:yes gene_type:complete
VKTVDLSHDLFHGAPSYSSDPDISISKEKGIDKDNSLLHNIRFGTHSGTHLDVPAHIILGGKTLSDFPLEAFFGIAVRIDQTNYMKIEQYTEKTDAVIFDTGWYKKVSEPDTFFGKDRPAIPADLVEYIINSNIKIFGCDLPSVDVSGSKDKPIHNALLGSNIIVYESLANLNQLPLLTPFEFYGFPLPFVGLDGSPVRAVAILD